MPQEYHYLSKINSFPTTKMGSINKLITENSLTRLINRLLDVDGFIITDGLADRDSVNQVIGNGGKHLSINTNLPLNKVVFRDGLLEFVLRGYYFAADVEELAEKLEDEKGQTGSYGLFARIFIDNSNPDYPELVGQTAYEDDQENFVEGLHYGVQFFVCPVDSKPEPYHPVLVGDGQSTIEDLGTDYLYFDLMLLEYIRDEAGVPEGTYIPYSSLVKFDTHSQSVIDGGVINL